MKIKSKFIYSVTIIQILIMLIFSQLILISQKKSDEGKYNKKKEQSLDFVRLSNMQAMFHLNISELEENISAVMEDEDICKIIIKDDFGTIIAETEEQGVCDLVENADFIIDDTTVGTLEMHFTKKHLNAEITELRQRIVYMMLLLILVMILTIRFVAKVTVKPIKSISEITKKISKGDFRNKIEIKTRDEMVIIGNSLNEIINRIRSVLLEIKSNFATISNLTDDIEAGNNSLVEKISEQADIVEQANESMNVVKKNIGDITDKVKLNNNFTKDTALKTIELRKISSQLKISMEKILISTKEIQNISELINEISFETNLLSLNASIEAARAGVQGRGFSVIAMKVRSLAKRSSNSVKKIDDLVEDCYLSVKSGEKIVEQALNYIDEVVINVEELEKSTEIITDKIADQEVEITEVNTLIEYLTDINQHHASLSEEYYTMIQELNLQAKNFSVLFNRFRLE